MMENESIGEKLKRIQDRIRKAAKSCGREPDSVRLIAVSKTIPENRIQAAMEAGVTALGENYIQEAQRKIENLSPSKAVWHFIGHLQTNKAKIAVKYFDLIHTLDSVKLARELNKQAAKINKIQKALIQVNVGQEMSKSGIEPAEINNLLMEVQSFKNLSITGLMTVPPYFEDPETVRPYFRELREYRDKANESFPGLNLTELSMGMTHDFEIAIEEGATMVRVGTAIFGERI